MLSVSFKKKTEAAFYCLLGGWGEVGVVVEKILNVQFYFQSPTFYFFPPPLN